MLASRSSTKEPGVRSVNYNGHTTLSVYAFIPFTNNNVRN